MRKEVKTISDLVNALLEEIARLDYKPAVVEGYYVVWNKLCKHAGERPADDFNMEFGMKFLDEAIRTHYKHLNENSKLRWMRAIYTLADFKRTNTFSMRRRKREFVFSEPAKSAFEQYVAHQVAIGLSEAYIRDTCLYLERFSKYLEHQRLENIAELSILHIHGFANSLPIYGLSTIYHTLSVLRVVLRYMHEKGILADDLSTALPKVPYSKKAKIPSVYTREEIERMVRSIDRAKRRHASFYNTPQSPYKVKRCRNLHTARQKTWPSCPETQPCKRVARSQRPYAGHI